MFETGLINILFFGFWGRSAVSFDLCFNLRPDDWVGWLAPFCTSWEEEDRALAGDLQERAGAAIEFAERVGEEWEGGRETCFGGEEGVGEGVEEERGEEGVGEGVEREGEGVEGVEGVEGEGEGVEGVEGEGVGVGEGEEEGKRDGAEEGVEEGVEEGAREGEGDREWAEAEVCLIVREGFSGFSGGDMGLKERGDFGSFEGKEMGEGEGEEIGEDFGEEIGEEKDDGGREVREGVGDEGERWGGGDNDAAKGCRGATETGRIVKAWGRVVGGEGGWEFAGELSLDSLRIELSGDKLSLSLSSPRLNGDWASCSISELVPSVNSSSSRGIGRRWEMSVNPVNNLNFSASSFVRSFSSASLFFSFVSFSISFPISFSTFFGSAYCFVILFYFSTSGENKERVKWKEKKVTRLDQI